MGAGWPRDAVCPIVVLPEMQAQDIRGTLGQSVWNPPEAGVVSAEVGRGRDKRPVRVAPVIERTACLAVADEVLRACCRPAVPPVPDQKSVGRSTKMLRAPEAKRRAMAAVICSALVTSSSAKLGSWWAGLKRARHTDSLR